MENKNYGLREQYNRMRTKYIVKGTIQEHGNKIYWYNGNKLDYYGLRNKIIE
jgi:hypothetical protein